MAVNLKAVRVGAGVVLAAAGMWYLTIGRQEQKDRELELELLAEEQRQKQSWWGWLTE